MRRKSTLSTILSRAMSGEYEHKDHVYAPEEWDRGRGEPTTIDHHCITPDGEKMSMDFSQWRPIDGDVFAAWVDLGKPRRGDTVNGYTFDPRFTLDAASLSAAATNHKMETA